MISMSAPIRKKQGIEVPREPSYEEIVGAPPTGVPGAVSRQGGGNPPGVSSAQLRRRLRGQAQPQPQPQQQQQEQAKAEEKPAEQQSVQEQQAGVPTSPTTGVLPRGDFKVITYSASSFNEAVLGLPEYAPRGGVKLVIQRSKFFSSPGKADDAWVAIVFTYSETPYGDVTVITPHAHAISCRNLATCVREGMLMLYKYSNKQILELTAKSGIRTEKLYKDTLLLPVCADKMCRKPTILVLDPDWVGGSAQVKNTGIEIQVRAVPANEDELFIQAGEKPIFHKYILEMTPQGTYVRTWERMDVT